MKEVNKIKNIFDIKDIKSSDQEVFENLFESKDIHIERIITLTPYDKPGEWYNQETDEWVMLLQGDAELEFKGEQISRLKSGDYIFIPAHKIHRINYSNPSSKCIWLAIHIKQK